MVWTDTFNVITIGSSPEIVHSSENYKKAKMYARLDDKI